MKKTISVALALLLIIAMCVPVFAGPGEFISSPSGSSGPELIKGSNSSSDCEAEAKLTPYSQRHTLDDEARAKLEKAYNDIANATDISTFNADLADLVKAKNIDTDDLAVSDLFDISHINCADHEGHGAFVITLRAESLEKFVGLLHLNGDKWELVKDAKAEEGFLHFTVDELSPFAIVVDTSADAPAVTGDSSHIGFYATLMVISAATLIFIGFKTKKRETN